ncbi:MAG: hypothetical protein ACPLXN_03555 [Sulfurihydrogenibium sp.]|uniref:hypothetical protein n=1 Tax=Sulfurihydrogenibium sp. TaxID=2053621 RepID=UPI003C7D337D
MDMKEKLQLVKEKLEEISSMPDLDLEINFFDENGNVLDEPYVLVKYYPTESDERDSKIVIPKTMLNEDVDNIVNYITFQIENFKAEIDSIEFGGE